MKSVLQFLQEQKFDVNAKSHGGHVSVMLDMIVSASMLLCRPVSLSESGNQVTIAFERSLTEKETGVKGGIHYAGIVTSDADAEEFDVIVRKNGIYHRMSVNENHPAYQLIVAACNRYVDMLAPVPETKKPDPVQAMAELLGELGFDVSVHKIKLH